MSSAEAKKKITVIGGGLAGTEAAWQLAQELDKHNLDYQVDLYEMRPVKKTPAHHTDRLAELVCSNSLGSEFLTTARGVLIREMEILGSLIIASAKKSHVPAGQALAVDRDEFAKEITEKIRSHPKINLIREELKSIPEGDVIIATGPLTSESLAEEIKAKLGGFLHFYDAASPIITKEGIDFDTAFMASRYNKGDGSDYINCPFYEQEDFDKFYDALINAERAPQKDFEKGKYFESCLPIEVIASRGQKTLTFGPMKPVGLVDPRFDPRVHGDESKPLKRPIAVVQLRQDNVIGSLYNIVGFQTNLRWGEQKRVFSMIPGLENLDIVRYGVMHQNIYINSPKYLDNRMKLKSEYSNGQNIYFAGQMTGVEGYTESAATGIIAARNLIASLLEKENNGFVLPQETVMGALANYISSADPDNFQPMNSNWGIININTDELDKKTKRDKKKRNEYLANRAIDLVSSCDKEPAAL